MNKPGWYPIRLQPWKAMKERMAKRLGRTPTARDAANHANHTVNVWEEYERRKAHISATATTTAEYDRRIRELIDELGI